MEEPLEFDLSAVVSRLKAEGYELGKDRPPRSDYQFLLALIGQPYLNVLFPDNEKKAREGTEQLIFPKIFQDQLAITNQAKLVGVHDFNLKVSLENALRRTVDGEVYLLTLANQLPWINALRYLIQFPDARLEIIRVLQPALNEHLQYVEQEPKNDPEYMDWEELVSLKMIFPENKDVTNLIRRRWFKWIDLLHEFEKKAKKSKDAGEGTSRYEAVMGLACAMHILAAEKAVINDEGLPEITPATKQLSHSLSMPERPLT